MNKEGKRNRKFVWTTEAVRSLISLYGENISNFLSPTKIQTKLWKRLVELMKEDESIQEEIREGLTWSIAQRKWISLQKEFKVAYYSFEGKKSSFPYYKSMNRLFTEYASEHLNSTFSGHNVTEADVTAFVGDLLNKSAPDSPDALRCESLKENKFISLNETKSESSKVRKELAKLPKSSVYVERAVMKIEPNTPFNRRYQLSTIVNQRKAMISSFKQSHNSEIETKFKTRRLTLPPERENDFSNVEHELMDFHIEALDECDLSKVKNTSDNIKIKSLKRPLPMHCSMDPMPNFSSTIIASNNNKAIESSDIEIIEERPHSVVEVPSMDYDSIDDLRASSEKSFDLSNLSIVPEIKKSFENKQDAPPSWFLDFLKRYDEDIKTINTKLDALAAQKRSSFKTY